MFGALTEKLQKSFSGLLGGKKLTEENISDAVRQVRMALLEADVNFGVVKTLINKIKEKALGEELIKSVSPGQQFVKIVHDELIALMGEKETELDLSKKPSVIMVCGLQGAGKTTQCAKLASLLKKQGKKVMLAACDLQRPAAVEQLKVLSKEVGVSIYTADKGPVQVAKEALEEAKKEHADVLIVDTAGRLHIDDELMNELREIKKVLSPQEILFVVNATMGQDGVQVAKDFDSAIEITGTILTMLDGNTRGGVAISIREITQKPLKFEGIGEKIGDLQVFNPRSMADRILGMGDTINLVKRAKEHMDDDQAKELEQKIRKATFTYDDYLKQMQVVKKMGSMKTLLKMLPGVGNMPEIEMSDGQFAKIEAIILSMTLEERMEKVELVPSRRTRIARGSGTVVDDVNKLVKSFKQAKQFFKNMPSMKNLEKMMGSLGRK